jgi:hypothetical protein
MIPERILGLDYWETRSVLCMVVRSCFENEAGRRMMVLCLLALSWRALPDVVSVVGDHSLPLWFFYVCQDTVLPVCCLYEALTDISHLAAVSLSAALLTYRRTRVYSRVLYFHFITSLFPVSFLSLFLLLCVSGVLSAFRSFSLCLHPSLQALGPTHNSKRHSKSYLRYYSCLTW